MPTSIRSALSRTRPGRTSRAVLVLLCVVALSACSDEEPADEAAPAGLVALVSDGDGTVLLGWDGSGDEGIPITLPKRDTTWIGTGRADVLAATLADGGTATSDPIELGTTLDWRPVRASGPNGDPPTEPAYFATWDPDGGRYATLAGDLPSGEGIVLVLIDPSVASAFEIAIDRSVVAAPPVWIGPDRVVVVTGDAAEPGATIIDTTTGELSDGPTGARLLAASTDGRRIATMAGPGAPIVIRDTSGWLDDDGSSVASIEPPDGESTAIAFALDADGHRLAVAWARGDGSVELAVHDGRSDWRRIAQPAIGSARGAVVAWRR